jgi:hypothetical protein
MRLPGHNGNTPGGRCHRRDDGARAGQQSVGRRIGRIGVGGDEQRTGAHRIGRAREPFEIERAVPAHDDRRRRLLGDCMEPEALERFDNTGTGAGEHPRTRWESLRDERSRGLGARTDVVAADFDTGGPEALDVVSDPAARVVREEHDARARFPQCRDRRRGAGNRHVTAPDHAVEIAADDGRVHGVSGSAASASAA